MQGIPAEDEDLFTGLSTTAGPAFSVSRFLVLLVLVLVLVFPIFTKRYHLAYRRPSLHPWFVGLVKELLLLIFLFFFVWGGLTRLHSAHCSASLLSPLLFLFSIVDIFSPFSFLFFFFFLHDTTGRTLAYLSYPVTCTPHPPLL
ncbi:hypothetical protein CC80DRAFT_196347 [Byssothecium circinans]|uniref:Uncharacterized protein n=1 Tax=Byssothecium circinans TaxID=147558 RepID=A0A6A5U949_9PLEO|nr:hypothetical protein CC80DRAFT_196347 [Byssothecium circinans]